MPTYDGAFDVIFNRRNSVNHAPTVDAGPDVEFEYASQFPEDPPSQFITGKADAQHRLTYLWRDEAGTWSGTTSPYLLLDYPFSRPAAAHVRLERDVCVHRYSHRRPWRHRRIRSGDYRSDQGNRAVGGQRILLGHLQGGRRSDRRRRRTRYDANLGRPKVNAPLANPPNGMVLGFAADPTQTYKLWIRLKADGNHWSNDSVWVQFTGSTDAQGNPAYRFGTTSGLAVNLEECSGCGVSGWGWEDDGWGAANRNGVTVRFPTAAVRSSSRRGKTASRSIRWCCRRRST